MNKVWHIKNKGSQVWTISQTQRFWMPCVLAEKQIGALAVMMVESRRNIF
jgi:hypothetical protein